MAIDRLNTLGFSYQRFPQNTKPINFGAVTCGTSEGTNDMIMILVNPLRLQITNNYTGAGFCINWRTKQYCKNSKSKRMLINNYFI